MPSVRLNSNLKVEFNEILQGLSKSELPDLEQFMDQLSTLVARKKAPSFSKEETKLLKEINKGLPEKFYGRYVALLTKSVEKEISEKEHTKLTEMVPIVEKYRIERLKLIIELSEIWKLSVDETMTKLGITPPSEIHA